MKSREWGQSVGWIVCIDAETPKVVTGVKTHHLQSWSEPSLSPEACLCLRTLWFLWYSVFITGIPISGAAQRKFPFFVPRKPQSEFTRNSPYFLLKSQVSILFPLNFGERAWELEWDWVPGWIKGGKTTYMSVGLFFTVHLPGCSKIALDFAVTRHMKSPSLNILAMVGTERALHTQASHIVLCKFCF